MGFPPDSTSTKPKEGAFQAVGKFLDIDAQMLLNVTPDRIDWQVIPIDMPNAQIDLPNVAELGDGVNPLVGPVSKWLSKFFPDTNRVAFGAVLLRQVADKVEGYEQLSKLLPAVTIDPIESSDFSYQINRPRVVDISGNKVQINRLSKWQVSSFRYFRVPVVSGDNVDLLTTPANKTVSVCRLELDINTSQSSLGNITPEIMPELLRELIDLGMEISGKGDVK